MRRKFEESARKAREWVAEHYTLVMSIGVTSGAGGFADSVTTHSIVEGLVIAVLVAILALYLAARYPSIRDRL